MSIFDKKAVESACSEAQLCRDYPEYWIMKYLLIAPKEVEYKKVDVGVLRSNYKLLAKTHEDTDIESIFEEIDVWVCFPKPM